MGKHNKRNLRWIMMIVFVGVIFSKTSFAEISDFDLSNSQVELDDFLSGGPTKDGIPALSRPKFITADQTSLDDHTFVIGITLNGESKAYPLDILNWHEIVNDDIAETPIAVTWCPLTKSGIVFDRRIEGKSVEYGVSGLLYNSNVVMYDRSHQGLWSQLNMSGLTGKYAGKDLELVASVVMTWGQWVKDHPRTLVLSPKTGYLRDYRRDPYDHYHRSQEVMFPVGKPDHRLPLKSMVIGISHKCINSAKGIPSRYDRWCGYSNPHG